MAQHKELKRVFIHGKNELPDPNPGWTPEKVMDFYSAQYPELTTANVGSREIKDDKMHITFGTDYKPKG